MGKRIYGITKAVVIMYLDFHISRASAALSFYLMLTIFPLLICLYSVMGGLFPSAAELRELLGAILPTETINTITDFLGYISLNADGRMLSFALAAMATGSAAGYRTVDKLMFELRGDRRKERFTAFLFSFAFSLVFLMSIYIGALLMATGGWFIGFADRHIDFLDVSRNWEWFRFVLLFLLLFVLILGVYRITAPKGREVLLIPGALSAAIASVPVSMLFSWFIGLSARYPVVYGSLASVMITLLWLYICCNILFLGNIINIRLEEQRGYC